jgi:parvulin-like peptidyl-prolyl isomerase
MTPLKKFTIRLSVYGAVVAYLLCDLFVFHGPLRKRIDRADPRSPEAIARAKANQVVARVFNFQITRSQLERALAERLWLEGKNLDSLPPAARKTARYAALNDLIDHELLRVKTKANAPDLKVSDAEIDAHFQLFSKQFESHDAMLHAMKSQGIGSERDLRDRLAARIQQEKYVESKIAPLIVVTDDEAREWFAKNQESLANPERIEVRHIFLPTLDHPSEEAKAKLETALSELTSGTKDFATLAKEISEDPATRERGGSLGWMTRSRLPDDFAAKVFPLPLNQPTLIQTRIGWHLVEITDRQSAEPRSFEEARSEVLAALETIKRRQATVEFRDALRVFETAKIEVFHDMLKE